MTALLSESGMAERPLGAMARIAAEVMGEERPHGKRLEHARRHHGGKPQEKSPGSPPSPPARPAVERRYAKLFWKNSWILLKGMTSIWS